MPLLSAFIVGAVTFLIVSFFSNLGLRIRLLRCRIEEPAADTKCLHFKGKTYDYDKFVRLQAGSYYSNNKKQLMKALATLESQLPGSKYPEFDQAIIDAHKLAIEERS